MIKSILIDALKSLREAFTILYYSTVVGVGFGLGLLSGLGIALGFAN